MLHSRLLLPGCLTPARRGTEQPPHLGVQRGPCPPCQVLLAMPAAIDILDILDSLMQPYHWLSNVSPQFSIPEIPDSCVHLSAQGTEGVGTGAGAGELGAGELGDTCGWQYIYTTTSVPEIPGSRGAFVHAGRSRTCGGGVEGGERVPAHAVLPLPRCHTQRQGAAQWVLH